MRGLFSRTHPSFERLLIVESGPRSVVEKLLPHFYEVQQSRHIDLLTCYEGIPATFDTSRGSMHSIHDPALASNRRGLVRTLSKSPYTVVAILCTGTPILEKWKWLIALRTSAKVLIVNEHAGYFFLDYDHRQTAGLMLSLRLDLGREINLHLVGEILLAPFTIAFLTLYALGVHLRRKLRTIAASS